MAATLTEIRTGLKTALATISGLSAYAVEPASPHYPAAWTLPRRAQYDGDFDGATTWTIGVTVAVAAADAARAQANLDVYLAATGTKSIRAAIDADTTLGGVADYARAVAVTGYFSMDVAGGSVIGATVEVEVVS